MFIGGLNWDTTDGTYSYILFGMSSGLNVFFPTLESLRDYFTQFGKVDACTIMRDAAGRSRCFAFLTFEEPASVNAVMVRVHFLDGKIVSRQIFAVVVSLDIDCVVYRLTPNERSHVKNINVRLSFSLEACRGA